MAKPDSKIGPIVGTFIVVIVLVAVALYVFASHINRQAMIQSMNSTTTITVMATSSKPDDIQTLKKDLNNAIR